ncbi:preprotein translocase subunit SecE [Mycoplasma enhydrae]|nr:preprotein translocase subunit SecE [Mycoplasma enhydrae]
MLKRQEKQARQMASKEGRLFTFRNFFREIKRVVWPKHSKSWKWFGITIAFLVVMAIFCFLVSLAFSSLWNVVGIKS